MFEIETKNYSKKHWLLNIAIIFVITSVLMASLYLIFEKKYDNKIYPGIILGEMDLSGKTPEELKSIINKKVNQINQNGITFYYQEKQTAIMPIVASLETDLAYEIINFDVEKTVAQAYGFGRGNNFFINLSNKIKAIISKQPIALRTTINEEEINQALSENFSQYEIPAEDAELIFKQQSLLGGMKNIQFDIEEEKIGKVINYQKGIIQLKRRLSLLDFSSIELLTKTDYPQIYKKNCLNIGNKARNILELAPLILKYEDGEWKVDNKQLAEWLMLKINPDNKNINKDKIVVGLNSEIVKKYLQDEIALKINEEPVEAKFEIKDGRVTEFQASRDGIELSIEESLAKIEIDIFNKQNQIELITKILTSNSSIEDTNDMGIKEIIGIGESDFSGSPKNRRHNIRTGANTLNGLLIKPDEEFSLMTALGEIDGSTGYLQELVIKDNKTIPEYGGGLCQIGTTMFRAALATGLPITMRRNHSYRVSYYEPAGTDATIYSPWPDLKFINDTGENILIQSRIEGDNLYFDFWGTKDGRRVEQTEPVIYNIVRPGPTKLIETLDLEPGKKKCTEHAHNGADAYFDYKVTSFDGEVKEKRFNSHYVPWQEVCLIGVEELSEDSPPIDGEKNNAEEEEENN
jgi:vancomycin resistance protein YoaR